MTPVPPGQPLIERLLAALPPEAREHAVLYVNEVLQEGGDPGAIPPGQPGLHWQAFADLRPGANWMHPALWLLASPDGAPVRVVETSSPPAFGRLPSGWRVAWQSPRVEPWQRMPTADQP